MPDATADRLVPVRAERYEALTELYLAALDEHLDILARDAHGFPGCRECRALRRLVGPDAPKIGALEQHYLDELHPTPDAPLLPLVGGPATDAGEHG